MHTIYRAGVNPARSLYRFWLNLLQVHHPLGLRVGSECFLGTTARRSIRVGDTDDKGRPIIALGISQGYGYHNSLFHLWANGDFRLTCLHGHVQRYVIAENTFLDYQYAWSDYVWLVSLEQPQHHRLMYYEPNHAEPLYVGERLMGLTTWATALHWNMRLARVGDSWDIVPAEKGNLAKWEHYSALRDKRRRRAELAWRRSQGLEPPPSPRKSAPAARVVQDGKPLEHDESILRVAALMDVSMPANSTPLRRTTRPKEAQDDHMDTANQL